VLLRAGFIPERGVADNGALCALGSPLGLQDNTNFNLRSVM
jgi:hypothetical protein